LSSAEKTVRFSGEPIYVGDYFQPPGQERLAQLPRIKYYPWKSALDKVQDFPDILEILGKMRPSGRRKFTLVDVKPQYLQAGELPCIPVWHCDVVDNPLHDSEHELHTMYVAGLNCPTKFLVGADISIPTEGYAYGAKTQEQCDSSEQWFAPEATIFQVARMHIHRCQPAQSTGWRLLLRVTETNNPRSRR
jgi:hypothetical protein